MSGVARARRGMPPLLYCGGTKMNSDDSDDSDRRKSTTKQKRSCRRYSSSEESSSSSSTHRLSRRVTKTRHRCRDEEEETVSKRKSRRRRRSRSPSSSSSSSDEERTHKHKKRKTRKAKRKIKKRRSHKHRRHKREKKVISNKQLTSDVKSSHQPPAAVNESCNARFSHDGISNEILNGPDKKEADKEEVDLSCYSKGVKRKAMAPMSREQYEQQQSVVREVYDEVSGRVRLIRGTGEIIERIVSRAQHDSINRTATAGDGRHFSRAVGRLAAKKA